MTNGKDEPGAESADTTVFRIPIRIKEHHLPGEATSPLRMISEKLAEHRALLKEHDDKILVHEEIIKTLTGDRDPHLALGRKMFLSPIEVAIYLRTTEELARKFVEANNIPTLILDEQDPDEWLVFRADIEDALEDQ